MVNPFLSLKPSEEQIKKMERRLFSEDASKDPEIFSEFTDQQLLDLILFDYSPLTLAPVFVAASSSQIPTRTMTPNSAKEAEKIMIIRKRIEDERKRRESKSLPNLQTNQRI